MSLLTKLMSDNLEQLDELKPAEVGPSPEGADTPKEEVKVEEQPPEPTKEETPESTVPGFYKGYDIKWLRKNHDHPAFDLVFEYDNLNK